MNNLIKFILIIFVITILLGGSTFKENFSTWTTCNDDNDCFGGECHDFNDKSQFMDNENLSLYNLKNKNKFCQINEAACWENKNKNQESSCGPAIDAMINGICNHNTDVRMLKYAINNFCKNKNLFLNPNINENICWD